MGLSSILGTQSWASFTFHAFVSLKTAPYGMIWYCVVLIACPGWCLPYSVEWFAVILN